MNLNVPGSEPSAPICSAKACHAAAQWVLAWNNPKIHTPERRKTWLACDEHRAYLSEFLGVRGFLKDVVEFDAWRHAAEVSPPNPVTAETPGGSGQAEPPGGN